MLNKIMGWLEILYSQLKNISIYNEKEHEKILAKYPRKSKVIKKRLKAHEGRYKTINKEKEVISKKYRSGEKVAAEEELSLLKKEKKEQEIFHSIKTKIAVLSKEQKKDFKEIENEISTRNIFFISIFLFTFIIGIALVRLSFTDIERIIENNKDIDLNIVFYGIPLIFISSSILLEIFVKNKSDKFYFIQYVPALLLLLLNSASDLDSKIEMIIIFIVFSFSFSLWSIFALFKVIDGLRELHNNLVLSIENPNERVTIYISIVGSIWASVILLFN